LLAEVKDIEKLMAQKGLSGAMLKVKSQSSFICASWLGESAHGPCTETAG
jgi:hypothetical protein